MAVCVAATPVLVKSGVGVSVPMTAGVMVAAIGASAAGAPAAAKTAAGPRAVLQTYIADFNRGDAAALGALFSPDVVFTTPLGGFAPCTGQAVVLST